VGSNGDLLSRAALVSESHAHLPFRLLGSHDPEGREIQPDLLIVDFDYRSTAEETQHFLNHVCEAADTVKVLLLCTEPVVLDHERIFGDDRQKLFLLPYFIPHPDGKPEEPEDKSQWVGGIELLKEDMRPVWWGKYSRFSGRALGEFPEELAGQPEITANPLLLQLIAQRFVPGQTEFADVTTLYDGLLNKVLARNPLLGRSDLLTLLEEIGVLTWHNPSRSTTLDAIVKHCSRTPLGRVLDKAAGGPQEAARSSIGSFFFRYDHDGEAVSFMHSTFADYLAARSVIRTME
jgi:hypothetical protein